MNERSQAALWRKAAVLGSLWASCEIVLGSFLHNARIPMRGHFMTFIAVALLVAGHRLWPERGLLWRSGLICAALKTISPSAFFFGPMLAISCQSFLLELAVAVAGANPLGYVLGGGLAMTWSLLHKIGRILLFYGPEAAALYGRAWQQARLWLGLSHAGPWIPLLLLGAANFLAGSMAAVIGLKVGEAPAPAGPPVPRPLPDLPSPSRPALFPYLYRILKRPKLWLGVLIASTLAGLLLRPGGGFWIGLRMGMRAVILTLGFAAIGWWLRSSAPMGRLTAGRRGLFLSTLDCAFNALPGFVAALPPGREILRNPVVCLRQMLAQVSARES